MAAADSPAAYGKHTQYSAQDYSYGRPTPGYVSLPFFGRQKCIY
jgi:hypothetical protein